MSKQENTDVSPAETAPEAIYNDVREEVGRVLVGNDDAIEHLTISLLTGGHLLMEGVPGVAKTTIATAFARATGLDTTRIQMTPDTVPADIIGTNVYREDTGEFKLRRGPIFTNVVVADEINRATPKTQSALLEAMQERNVTIEGQTLPLPEPFLVVATQNPIEMEGVFELPEAQRDRFQFKLEIDLPGTEIERELVDRFNEDPSLGPTTVEQTVTADSIATAQSVVEDIYVAPSVKDYLVELVEESRQHPNVEYGASPRATLMFLQAMKARAAIDGREYVIPDDLKALAPSILAHRLVLNTDAQLNAVSTDTVVDELVAAVEPPGAETVTPSD